MNDDEPLNGVRLSRRELKLIINAMMGVPIPFGFEKEVFELTEKLRTILGEAT